MRADINCEFHRNEPCAFQRMKDHQLKVKGFFDYLGVDINPVLDVQETLDGPDVAYALTPRVPQMQPDLNVLNVATTNTIGVFQAIRDMNRQQEVSRGWDGYYCYLDLKDHWEEVFRAIFREELQSALRKRLFTTPQPEQVDSATEDDGEGDSDMESL